MSSPKPAGVQIKRWLLTLVVLLLTVNILAVSSLFLVYSYVDDIKSAYQPIAKSSSIIIEKILGAQLDLYKYLSEYQTSLSPAFTKIDILKKEIKKIERAVKEHDIENIEMKLLTGAKESTIRFEKAIRKLKDTEDGDTTDWEKVNLLRSLAVEMGTDTQNDATKVNNAVNLMIRKQNIHVAFVTLIVVSILFIFFIISILIMIQLHYWWRKFEDLIIEL